MRIKTVTRGAVFFLLVITTSCQSSESPNEESVVYTSVDAVFARPIVEAFQEETGIKVQLVADTMVVMWSRLSTEIPCCVKV